MRVKQTARPVSSEKVGSKIKEGGVAAFRILEHTADMGIEAQAPDCSELFKQAARGLLAVLGGSETCSGEARNISFDVTADDIEELLVVWLNELLYLVQTKGLWPLAIDLVDMQPGALRTRLKVVPLAGDLLREVKAVTYHHLQVSCRNGFWRARVYLDV
jgi:SHS2 domain-containing protein